MEVGYVRASTVGQDLATQEQYMESKGVKKIFGEKVLSENRTEHSVNSKTEIGKQFSIFIFKFSANLSSTFFAKMQLALHTIDILSDMRYRFVLFTFFTQHKITS